MLSIVVITYFLEAEQKGSGTEMGGSRGSELKVGGEMRFTHHERRSPYALRDTPHARHPRRKAEAHSTTLFDFARGDA